MTCPPGQRFDAVAEAYDQSRPGYPASLVDRLGPPGDTLEIGCGSGQLTVDLLSRGHCVLGVDIGGELLARARRRCPTGDFVLGAFEEVDLPEGRFSLVVSATAFH
nr:class I SAM-dependent methyltransferase [Acidimicrobiia bacterium]